MSKPYPDPEDSWERDVWEPQDGPLEPDARDVDYILDDEEWERRTRGERVLGVIQRGFHEDCGFAWSIHDSRMVGPVGQWKGPFGCPPSETAARERWGR